MGQSSKEIEMNVAGMVVDPGSNAPIVLLKEVNGETCLPIWIGMAEATAIASALKKIELMRPMTHDLLKNMLDELGARVVKISITDLKENTFIAAVEMVVGELVKVVDARPSDAIALAVRTDAPIMVSSDVLKNAQVTLMPVEGIGGEGEGTGVPEELLATDTNDTDFASIDKDRWAEILAEMDPDDFKYKM